MTDLILLVPTWINVEDVLDANDEVLNGKLLKIVAVQAGEAQFSSDFLKNNDFAIDYDQARAQSMLYDHEIMKMPCFIDINGNVSTLEYNYEHHGYQNGDTLDQNSDSQEPELESEIEEKHPLFAKAMEAYDMFDFNLACSLFNIIINDNDKDENEDQRKYKSSHESAVFNMAGMMHMLGYPTLSVYYAYRLLSVTDDVPCSTFLWNITQAAAEGAGAGAVAVAGDSDGSTTVNMNVSNNRHLLECCVKCYQMLCEKNKDDVTSMHRLATLGRSTLHRGGGSSNEQSVAAAKALNAYARRIYEDMGEAFESRLVDKLGYRGPSILYDMVTQVLSVASTSTSTSTSAAASIVGNSKVWNILDVGCGSGLVGKSFHPLVISSSSSNGTGDNAFSDISPACMSNVYEDISPLILAKEKMVSTKGKGCVECKCEGVMIGVDISSKMCEITIKSQYYTHVACCDAVVAIESFIPSSPSSPSSSSSPATTTTTTTTTGAETDVAVLDMVIVADTFIYLGPLGPSFAAAKKALKPGGLLVFSIENLENSNMRLEITTTDLPIETSASASSNFSLNDNNNTDILNAVPGWGGALLSSSRYAHSPKYIEVLASLHGLQILLQKSVVLRTESTLDVRGQMYVMRTAEIR
jgi:predicted TPR repeat methyltransferase